MALTHYAPPTVPYIKLLFQDDWFIAVDKPSGLLSVPGKDPKHHDSMATRVQKVYPTATVVHRLDMATSGLMLFALCKAAHRAISRQFELRQVEKAYIARVYGTPTRTEGEVSLPLICDWPNRPKQKVDMDSGKPALTRWQQLESGGQSSLIALYPKTGRSHQLRVHMQSLGHPILGDRLYAHAPALTMAARLQLHACELRLNHPHTGVPMHLHSVCPFAPEVSDQRNLLKP